MRRTFASEQQKQKFTDTVLNFLVSEKGRISMSYLYRRLIEDTNWSCLGGPRGTAELCERAGFTIEYGVRVEGGAVGTTYITL